MKNKNQVAFLIILVAAASATLFFVILPPILYGANQQEKAPAPEQVVQSFYEGYLTYEGNPLTEKAYRSSSALSTDLIHQLDEQPTGELIADPLLCAQDVPESITISAPSIADKTASVEVQTSLGNHFTVHLTRDGNSWKISQVVCQ